jgi:hypothetical protein
LSFDEPELFAHRGNLISKKIAIYGYCGLKPIPQYLTVNFQVFYHPK